MQQWDTFTLAEWDIMVVDGATTTTGANTVAYDAGGNRLTKTDQVTSGVTTYTYSNGNELLTSQDASGITTYTYDANGNRETITDPSFTVTHNEWDPENRLIEVSEGLDVTEYLYNGDGLLVEKQTDKYAFDAFGNETSSSGSTANSQRYKGEYLMYHRDPDAGPEVAYALHHRHYEPETGTFSSRDPAKDDLNLYRYVRNNPVNREDPTGLQPPERIQLKTPIVLDGKLLKSVPAAENGEPDLSKYSKGDTEIVSTGKHSDDQKRAHRQLEKKYPRKNLSLYIKHHHVTEKIREVNGVRVAVTKIQLIPKELHKAVGGHTGSRSLAQKFYEAAGTSLEKVREAARKFDPANKGRLLGKLKVIPIGIGINLYLLRENVQAHGVVEGVARSTPLLGDLIQIGEDSAAIAEALGDINEVSKTIRQQEKSISNQLDQAATIATVNVFREIFKSVKLTDRDTVAYDVYGLLDADIDFITSEFEEFAKEVRKLLPEDGKSYEGIDPELKNQVEVLKQGTLERFRQRFESSSGNLG